MPLTFVFSIAVGKSDKKNLPFHETKDKDDEHGTEPANSQKGNAIFSKVKDFPLVLGMFTRGCLLAILPDRHGLRESSSSGDEQRQKKNRQKTL